MGCTIDCASLVIACELFKAAWKLDTAVVPAVLTLMGGIMAPATCVVLSA